LIITIDFVANLRYNKTIEKRKAVVPMYDEQNSPASKNWDCAPGCRF